MELGMSEKGGKNNSIHQQVRKKWKEQNKL
jgi:hypothetical protein